MTRASTAAESRRALCNPTPIVNGPAFGGAVRGGAGQPRVAGPAGGRLRRVTAAAGPFPPAQQVSGRAAEIPGPVPTLGKPRARPLEPPPLVIAASTPFEDHTVGHRSPAASPLSCFHDVLHVRGAPSLLQVSARQLGAMRGLAPVARSEHQMVTDSGSKIRLGADRTVVKNDRGPPTKAGARLKIART